MTQSLRQQLIQRRNSVPLLHRSLKANQAAHHLKSWPHLSQAREIGCYLNVQGELPTRPLIQMLWKQDKRVLLPLLHNDGSPTLHFHPYTPGTAMTENKFGIPEPYFNPWHEHPAPTLDLVLMPLVGFDRYGSRIGMGGGFYDRTFEFVGKNTVGRQRPFLMGLAMNIQEVEKLDSQQWDIPLDGVLTESGIQIFS